MSAKLISNENNKAVYEIEIAWDDFYQATDRVYRQMRGQIQIPGFRKGHAPRKIVEANYGKGIFYDDALNDLLPNAIRDAIKELDLEAIGKPQIEDIEINEKEPLIVKVENELRPHPELADFKGMEVEKVNIEISDAEVDSVINAEQDKNAVLIPIEDRPAQEKDVVKLDYTGTIDGEAFEGGSQEDAKIVIGSHQFIPGFEEQIVGHSAGEEFDINVTFPENYQASDLAGKEAVFHIKLNEVFEKELPELDDEFAQDVSEFDTLEEYKDDVRENLKKQKEDQAKAAVETNAVRKLVEISEIEAPKSMVETEVDHSMTGLINQLNQMGLSLDQYMKYTGQDMDSLRKQYEPMAELRVTGDLALQSLVEQEEIDATEEEVDEEIKEMGKSYGSKDLDDFVKKVRENGDEKFFKNNLLKKKALEFLMDNVKLVEPKVEEKEDEVKEEVEDSEEESEE